MPEAIIRQIQEHELEPLLELYTHLNPNDAPVERGERLDAQWERMVANPDLEIWVADEGGDLVASCSLVLVDNLTRGARPYALIENVVTRADRRRLGYGHAVLKAAIESARERGCYKVMLMTSSKQESVLSFYEGAGFLKGYKTGFYMQL
ncbi:GNAT family N-acetyltransferase [Paenibacillus kobensis]|uniref:GNAT family N-acetyltransferase n=1 Tax=Paenibacillus kobensis TaxID=59841 RepID=UPI000FD8B5FC|nr:GNAT family N-acetyltransferase [Paenibacillus kobensis]